ncbi:MAG: acyl-CoA synthetase FdrA [Chloroflexota bacterium]
MRMVNLVKRNRYQDSVTLMQAAVKLREVEGIDDASLMMGTEPNKEILADAGLLEAEGRSAGPNDLIISLRGTEEGISTAIDSLEAIMAAGTASADTGRERVAARSLRGGLAELPEASLVLISTPGIYAAAEARKALASRRHVMIFSDNVSLEDEIMLKQTASERGLLLMGPDCGTAIIGGVPLGFANAVRRGPIGVVGASGTGMQQITSLIDRYGGGISHAIGTGSHDLSAQVGASSTLAGLAALQNDPNTRVIVIVSKPPDPEVAARVIAAASESKKPVIIAFLGMEARETDTPLLSMAQTLEDAARQAVARAEALQSDSKQQHPAASAADASSTPPPQAESATGGIRGLFSGGTFCYEAMLVLEQSIGPIFSNTPLTPDRKIELENPKADIHNRYVCLDLGADEFTVGRPHPMIDMTTRIERILLEAANPEVGIILLDVVLGYGAHPDPAGALAPAIRQAIALAKAEGRTLQVVASVCGTEADPQQLSRQRKALKEAGVTVAESNAGAARLVAAMLDHTPYSQKGQSLLKSLGRTQETVPYRPAEEPISVQSSDKIAELLAGVPVVLNVGVPTFADTLTQLAAPHLHVDWQPPAGGDPILGRVLAALTDEETAGGPGALIKAANDLAIERILAADPVWEDVRPAREIWPEMDDRLLFHSGPPIQWSRMCGPMQGAVIGAILLEGWAADEVGARVLAESGSVKFAPCHHYGAVGPMAGLVSPSMPMFVVRNAEGGNMAYSSLNEGMGKVLRYGAFAPEVLARLRWMCDTLGPTLKIGIQALGGVHLKPLMSQALQMGDELHNRHVAATSLLFKTIAPALIRAIPDRELSASALDPIAANNYFFLNLAMAAAKATLDAAHGIPHSTVVTAMARNGVEFGIRVSGTGNQWFTGPAGFPVGLYLPGFSQDDAAGDIGDSAITETVGLGGFAMGGAPAVVKVVGGTPADAVAYTGAMYTITLARNPQWTLPPMGFTGTPTGIDVRLVVDSGTLPIINTGIAHKEAGIGQVGAGLVNPPMSCFIQALTAISERA